jgi:hypothetical protein
MRYRKLDENRDMTFGRSSGNIWHDAVDAVGQSILTRLLLFTGEWYLDITEGTPWGGFPFNRNVVEQGRILAEHTQLSRDAAIKDRVLTTDGVLAITNYGSSFDPDGRGFSVNMTVDTIYGSILEFTLFNAARQTSTEGVVVSVRSLAR